MPSVRLAPALFAAAALLAPGTAAAHGPFGAFGVSVTPARNLGGADFAPFFGPTARVGYEFGERWNSEISLQVTQASSKGTADDIDVSASFTTYAVGYRFTVDILGKEGFTPYVGTGVYLGAASMNVEASQGAASAADSAINPLLEFHASVGARYTFESGLNFRAELTGSTYGGLLALQPSVGVGYQF